MYKLFPLGMSCPNSKNIYTPSKIVKPKTVDIAEFSRYTSREILVKFEPSLLPVKMLAWNNGLAFWHLVEFE